MFQPTLVLIDAFSERLRETCDRAYGRLEPEYPGIIGWSGRMALEIIANSDALYHDVNHTIMVTLVGQEILKGKHQREGGVTPGDWLHFILSLLCHDIGYVRGFCRADREGVHATGVGDETVELPPGATDAALAPYHVDRGKLFIRERFAGHELIDAEVIAANIERTRFPVPQESDYQCTSDYPGLVRAADLIGQLADPQHDRRYPALFHEFEETGVNVKLGVATPDDLRASYPAFFWGEVSDYIQDGLRHLRVTVEGRQWMGNLYAHVFAGEYADKGVKPV